MPKKLHLFLFLQLIVSVVYADDCIITNYKTFIEYNGQKLVRIDTVIMQVNNPNGENYTYISIPYSSGEKLSNVTGWIEDCNGVTIRKLKNSEIKKKNRFASYSFYEDQFVNEFHLKHNNFPYKICFTYKYVCNQFIQIVDWSPDYKSNVSTLHAELHISIPKRIKYNTFIRSLELAKKDSLNDVYTYIYHGKFNRNNIEEPFQPTINDTKPRILVVPYEFKYGIKGCSESWKAYGDWVLKLNSSLNDLPQSEKAELDKILNETIDTVERIKKIYYYLQDHTRYINVSVGIGGFKSYPASYVAQNKYGDCKALSNYMKSMLEYAGIKSQYILVNASEQPEQIIEQVPCAQFNHIFLIVPYKNDTFWIENTANTIPFNYLVTSVQNRKALLLEEGSSRLINIPAIKKCDIINRMHYIVDISNEDAIFNANFQFKGYEYEFFNGIEGSFNLNEQDIYIKDYMPFKNYEVIDWKLKKYERDSSTISLKTKSKIYKFLNKADDSYYFQMMPVQYNLLGLSAKRSEDFSLPYPIVYEDNIKYNIPENFEVNSIPDSVTISNRFCNYKLIVKNEIQYIYVYKRIELNAGFYKLDQYKEIFSFLSSIKKMENKYITLKRKS